MTLRLQQKIARIYLKTIGMLVILATFVGFCFLPWEVEVGLLSIAGAGWAMWRLDIEVEE